ncbi:MAG: hypothetical protein WA902_07240 [Thermosynechococcaceae cyanobacterium]
MENQGRIESDHRHVDKQVEKARKQADKKWRTQQSTDFSCQTDALKQAKAIAARWRYHTLAELSVVETRHYQSAGRPKTDESPTEVTYRTTATVVEDGAH